MKGAIFHYSHRNGEIQEDRSFIDKHRKYCFLLFNWPVFGLPWWAEKGGKLVRRGRSNLKACTSDNIDQESQVVQSSYHILQSAITSEMTSNDIEMISNDYSVKAVN